MITFETSTRIERPVEQVFDCVSDPLLFPRWNSAVQDVNNTSGSAGAVGSTYSMRRELPSGQVENELEILASEPPSEFAIRTISGPTPFRYRYRFVSDGRGTVVRLEARVELSGVAGLLGPVASRAVRRGVDANFAALKRVLEASTSDAPVARMSAALAADGSTGLARAKRWD
jgi:uncharacterized protein YndB with AHSA1/START domain